jgi:hypothetical protein
MARARAWGGRRCQPDRALSPGDPDRWGWGSRRGGLGALARKRLRARGRGVEGGVGPAGAVRTGPVAVEEEGESRAGGRSWEGRLVAGHGCAPPTEAEEERSTTGVAGAESADRGGGRPTKVDPARRPFGASEPHGSRSHQQRAPAEQAPKRLPRGTPRQSPAVTARAGPQRPQRRRRCSRGKGVL